MDPELLERVQRRATRMVPELRDLDYEDRLRKLDLPSLMYRRQRGDLIEVFKYQKGLYRVESERLLPPATEGRTRASHEFKIFKQQCRIDVRKKFFGLRVVKVWNSLPDSVVQAPTVNCFKGRLDRHLRDYKFATTFPLIPDP